MLPGVMASLVSFTMIPKNSSSTGADSMSADSVADGVEARPGCRVRRVAVLLGSSDLG
jgi:hypothetical protein